MSMTLSTENLIYPTVSGAKNALGSTRGCVAVRGVNRLNFTFRAGKLSLNVMPSMATSSKNEQKRVQGKKKKQNPFL